MTLYDMYIGLEQALNVSFMLPLLQENGQVPLLKCYVDNVRIDLDHLCTILYRASTQSGGTQYFSARLGRGGESFPFFEHPKVLTLHALKAQVLPFPYDLKLTWLHKIYDKPYLSKALEEIFLKPIKEIDVELLAYTPCFRATHRFHIKDHEGASFSWIGKTNVYKDAKISHSNYLNLWNAACGKTSMPKPLGFLNEPALAFQNSISGHPLGSQIKQNTFSKGLLNLALMTADFHSMKFKPEKLRTLEKELKWITRAVKLLGHLCPNHKSLVDALYDELKHKISKTFKATSVIHADFHHTNILLDGANVSMVDMEEVSFGDPALDIGRFLSSLRLTELKIFGSVNAIQDLRDDFLKVYLINNPTSVEKIKLFEAAALLNSAVSCFRFQRKKWMHDTEILLYEAERILKKET